MKCKMCGKEIPNHRIYCSNKCKFSDYEYNLRRKPKIKNNKTTGVKCTICEYISSDALNLSGALTKHLKTHNIIDKNVSEYFTEISTPEIEYWNCPICKWKTTDITNLSGAITKHIKNIHSMTLIEFDKKFPDNIKNNNFIRTKNLKKNFITCQICGEKMFIVSNSHLKEKHNITQKEYKKIYGDTIISSSMKKKLKKCGGIKDINFISRQENEIKNFLLNNTINVKQTYRKLNIEIDLFVPDKNIAIEFNGLFWHSELNGKDKKYHLEKTEICEKENIHLIHIFEDEWKNKTDIVKSKLLNIFGKTENRIYARKCKIKEISSTEKKLFLQQTHIQGDDKSSIFVGAFYDDALVAVMTFGQKRIALGSISAKNHYELMRFSTKLNYTVIGIASKLLKYFITKYNPEKIISYADRRWTFNNQNNLYHKIGFELKNITRPNYFYMKKYEKRLHRFNFTKHRIVEKFGGDKMLSEWENMQLLEYDRIWDCGSLKYELSI